MTEIAAEYNRLRAIHGDDFGEISKGISAFYKSLPKGHPSKKYARARNADERGVWRDNNISWHGGGGPVYDIIHPTTGMPCKVPDDGWRFVQQTMEEKIEEGFVEFRDDHTKPPIYKTYVFRNDELGEGEEGQKEVLGSVFYRHTQPSNDLIKEMFGAKVFPNPKDHEILAKYINYVCNDDDEALILDSFAGSGSTGHAVLSINSSINKK